MFKRITYAVSVARTETRELNILKFMLEEYARIFSCRCRSAHRKTKHIDLNFIMKSKSTRGYQTRPSKQQGNISSYIRSTQGKRKKNCTDNTKYLRSI
jgi:hypothetical protein